MKEYEYFLKANPDIQKMMNNDVSLRNIASLEQIKNLNLYYLRCPQLFLDTDIDYNLYSFDISNFSCANYIFLLKNRLF